MSPVVAKRIVLPLRPIVSFIFSYLTSLIVFDGGAFTNGRVLKS